MNKSTDLIYEFDDLIRCFQVICSNSCEKEFLSYVLHQEESHLKWIEIGNENKRLKTALDAANKDISVLDSKLTSARRWLDSERQQRKRVENERDSLSNVFEELRRLILSDPCYKLPDETRERISSISKAIHDSVNGHRTPYDRLNTITELDSTASDVSVSFSRSEDDLDETNKRTRHRPSYLDEEPVSAKKKKSGVFIPFTPTAPRAESLESLDSDQVVEKKSNCDDNKENMHTPVFNRLIARTHNFTMKRGGGEYCLPCKQKIGIFKTAFKCSDCNAVAHPECREKVPLPCVAMGTPSKSGTMGIIADYAPLVPPMIPAIVIHCINEVEQRGLKEIGIYRIPGIDREVRNLKDKFLKCKGVPCLSEVDIHTVCGCLKDFLRTLRDPLVPHARWNTFAEAVFKPDKTERMYQAVSTLPQANRDTLAFLILHLQRVASSPGCKMPIANLSSTFGPIVVGRSNSEQANLFQEAQTANTIMEELLMLSPGYWSSFIVEPAMVPKTPSTLRNTPSTESLMRKTSRKFLTTPGSRKRFFNTPPLNKNNDG